MRIEWDAQVEAAKQAMREEWTEVGSRTYDGWHDANEATARIEAGHLLGWRYIDTVYKGDSACVIFEVTA